jgi:hypothetical protein
MYEEKNVVSERASECVGGLYYILNCNFTATHTNYFIHTEYERDSLNLAWKKVEAIMPNNIMAKLKLFC